MRHIHICPMAHNCEWIVIERGSLSIMARFDRNDYASAEDEAERLNNTDRNPAFHYYVAHNEDETDAIDGHLPAGPLKDPRAEHERWLNSLDPSEVLQYI